MAAPSIWFNGNISLEQLNRLSSGNMSEYLEIEFIEIGPDFLRARMPVTSKTKQPYGLLHGGASVVLAETVGSVASAIVVDWDQYQCVGLEVNANHLRAIRDGFVQATCRPVHLGRKTHVWDIRLTDDAGKLTCISRLTVAIIAKKL